MIAMYDVVALGELLIDFATQGSDAGGYPTMKANPGGAPGIFLSTLAKFGAKTAFLGKVGQDAFGDLLLGTMKKAGISTNGILQDANYFTTLAFVTLDSHGERSFSFARKPGADTRLTWEETEHSMIEECRVFHFGSLSLTNEPSRTTTRKAVELARDTGKLITFDPNLRLPLWSDAKEASDQIFWGLRHADVVKISDEEMEFLWNCCPEEGARRLLDECGVSLAMVTLGPKGCYLLNRKGAVTVTCPQVKSIDTTGAGDIFCGSAVSRLLALNKSPADLTSEELAELGRFAVTAASLSTEHFGGIPSIPAERDVLNRMSAEQ